MNRADRAGAVTQRGGNAFHRLSPDISGGEDSRAGRFERQRIEADVAEIAVSEDEPLGIEFHETFEEGAVPIKEKRPKSLVLPSWRS